MDIDSDSSSLSSAPEEEMKKLAPIFQKAKKATKLAAPPPVVSPPRPKRPPSPPHEEVLADNADIAFIVMFRSRFSDAFSSKLPHFGPQDLERGVVDTMPGPHVEGLLCALLALVLNRKKPVERGHHGRALEEAVQTNKSQWPSKWASKNPLHGGKDFSNMTPIERLNLLRTLAMWALTSSEAISDILKNGYKQNRHNDDENQPLAVQPWGNDGDKRRYFLVQGQDDSSFRVYRENSRHTKNAAWWSVAGDIEDIKKLAEKLEKEDGSQAARRLSIKMINAIPLFEATDEKRRRKEYRQQRRAAFSRPEPGFGIYEGRTRGKRLRYTYEDDDAFSSDATSTRRSTRQQSARSTPFEAMPTVTASGRQTRRPQQGEYGESLLSANAMLSTDELAPEYDDDRAMRGTGSGESDPVRSNARATRSGGRQELNGASNPRKRKNIDGYNDIDDMSDENDASASGDEWDSDNNDAEDDERMPDVDDEPSGSEGDLSDGDEHDDASRSLMVKLKLPKTTTAKRRDTPPTSPPSPGDRTDVQTGVRQSFPPVYGPDDEAIAASAIKSETSTSAPSNGLVSTSTAPDGHLSGLTRASATNEALRAPSMLDHKPVTPIPSPATTDVASALPPTSTLSGGTFKTVQPAAAVGPPHQPLTNSF